jgi:holo-[acyl-carrier protein] synthase
MTAAAPEVRVGVDLVDVGEVADAVTRFGDRYLGRIYTEHELDCCRHTVGVRHGSYATESLAARFAAKEAVLKILRPIDLQPAWRSIELHRMTGGWTEIHLSGTAAAMAAEVGVERFAVSLTHESALAAAVVVAWCAPNDEGEG